jgi:hypothetical protein
MPVIDHSVFDMTEDLVATNINAEEEVMTIEPYIAGCGVDAGGNQVQSADSGDCALQIIAKEQDDELSASDWEGITVEDFDRLYRLLHSQYKEFHKRHRSSEHTIQGMEGEIKGLHSRIKQLEDEIEDLKAMDDEELKKFAKTEEVQALEANMHVLESQLDFERGQFTELQGKYKELLDWFFILDHWEGFRLPMQLGRNWTNTLMKSFINGYQWR